jgi:hypothetical protein
MSSKNTDRKLELIFEVVLHIANKLLDDEAMEDLKTALAEVNGKYEKPKKVMH